MLARLVFVALLACPVGCAAANTAPVSSSSSPPAVVRAEPLAMSGAAAEPAQPPAPAATVEPAAEAASFCDDQNLAALLAEYEAGERSLGGPERASPLTPADLERVTPNPGTFGDVADGPGVFGSLDVDGDAKADVLLHYASVDYWAWLAFVPKGACLGFVGFVEGYQVEIVPARGAGIRETRVLTYPLQGRIERRPFARELDAR